MQPFNKKRRPGEKKAGKSFSDAITSRKRWNYNLKYCLNISLADKKQDPPSSAKKKKRKEKKSKQTNKIFSVLVFCIGENTFY